MVVEIELEDTVRPVTAVEVAAVEGKVVELVMAEFKKNEGYTCEFVLVNDGSTDGTWPEIQALGKEYDNV